MTFLTIFRASASGDTKTVSDRVEFDFTDPTDKNSTPDSTAFITDMQARVASRQTDLGNPDSHASDSPDTGTTGLYLTINGTFNEKAGQSKAKIRLLKWSLEPKIVKGVFREARFGLDCDELSELNVTPGTDTGYKLDNFEYYWRADQAGNRTFTIVLRRVGVATAFATRLGNLVSPVTMDDDDDA